ncbi:unnamed protein product [Cyclocybe aegerita]|uniref:Uncharacterized protein n=1 Tax=Cyclocybe aegerita TaxID=1973307 RepID=A0A8S0WEZ7_CYCAE|nr:unnamed protein product [Cyclocybe aegerita]
MSQMKQPMLSTVHAIFCSLQDHVQDILHDLLDTILQHLKDGLVSAHQKLSEYYYKLDKSPFYTWAVILNPHIMYEGLKLDFADEQELLSHLDNTKTLTSASLFSGGSDINV